SVYKESNVKSANSSATALIKQSRLPKFNQLSFNHHYQSITNHQSKNEVIMKTIITTVMVSVIASVQAQQVPTFSKIEAANNVDVTFAPGEPSAIIIGDGSRINASVRNSSLIIEGENSGNRTIVRVTGNADTF